MGAAGVCRRARLHTPAAPEKQHTSRKEMAGFGNIFI